MNGQTKLLVAGIAAAALIGGCANDGSLSTASVASTDKSAIVAPKVDPACTALASQIEGLRKDSSLERLEKASIGKTANVQVKRATLIKQAELNKANADFQAKCGPPLARAQTAQVTATPANPAAASTTSAAPAKAN